jgi:2-oxoglutarate dehydrogenase E1 component
VDEPIERVFEKNPEQVEAKFELFQKSAFAVSPEWRAWFDGFRSGFVTSAQLCSKGPSAGVVLNSDFDAKVVRLTESYKRYGHVSARVNPLGLNRDEVPALSLERYALSESDSHRWVAADAQLRFPEQRLVDRISGLRKLFCESVSPEFEHVESFDEKDWLYAQVGRFREHMTGDEGFAVFRELAFADAFEKTLSTKYVGKKRFSIEGADAQIPALETLLDAAASQGVRECIMGMAHRGRLAIIVGVVKMPFEMMLAEFEGEIPPDACCDDVKYHCGFESSRRTRSGLPMAVKMVSNPSHLEAVDPVLQGEVRARQDLMDGGNATKVLPVLLHGDAAISGQGVVYETLQMANLSGYSVGGTIHVVANNQLGFTTAPEYSRSSTSCTDVAKVISAPVVHVNSEDLDAVHQVMKVALEYRQRFGKDFFIDLVCYRRHGHNEADEPTYTQPSLYRLIKEKPAAWMLWRDALVARTRGEGFSAQLDALYKSIRMELDGIYLKMKRGEAGVPAEAWTASCGHPSKVGAILASVETAVTDADLARVGKELLKFPPYAKPHSKLARKLLADRALMIEGELAVDWGFAENLAYGSLVAEGFSFRLSGQDVGRGTFSHRHAVFVDEESGEHYLPIRNLKNDTSCQKHVAEVINSPLSEFAVLGFEYGYARNHPRAVTVWEAQFGDFVNGAQIILDQFLSAGECKWHRVNNLVLLLPHGFEGQGAEHSSGRLERFLQLAADGNMIVANVTSAAQLFHILRRQAHSHAHKPLVLFTPKSYLRSPLTASALEAFTSRQFEEIVDDGVEAVRVERVVFCAGKMALDLSAYRDLEVGKSADLDLNSTAVVRIEQLYPLHTEKMAAVVKKYVHAKSFFWAQEEPRNMGAWQHVAPEIEKVMASLGVSIPLRYIGRHAKSSPAGGLEKIHKLEQSELLRKVFSATKECEV